MIRLLNVFFAVLLSCIVLAGSPPAAAQSLGALGGGSDAEPAQDAAELIEQDPLGRDTPRGAFGGYIRAIAEEDYAEAARYLELVGLPARLRGNGGADLAKHLRTALDQGGNVQPSVALSDDPSGRLDDGLDPDLDRIGSISVGGETIPLLLQRTEKADEALWKISAQTLRELPSGLEDGTISLVDQLLPGVLLERKWQGVPIGHWLAMLALAMAAYIATRLVVPAITGTARRLLKRRFPRYPDGLVQAFALPVQIYLAVLLFAIMAQRVGISIIVRQYFSQITVLVAWLAVLLLAWRLVDVIAKMLQRRMTRRANLGALSAVMFFRRSFKVLLGAVGVITILDIIGFDVTTGLAALGIGGIAIALGAQKTVENLVGGLSLIFDQPVRVGDFCKVGDIVGTVEQIGMRSTRIRTLDRTMVVIPNGDFSGRVIENYAYRDTYWFHPTFGFRYETTPDQIRYLLVEIRSMLYSHPRVDPDPARVRFLGFGASSVNIEIFAYVHAEDYSDYLEVQEDLHLRVADIVAASGTGFAFPSQTVYLAQDAGLSKDKTQAAEERIRAAREQGDLPLPRFDADRIRNLKDGIAYPPTGSSDKQ